MGLAFLAIAAFLFGGVIAFAKQGKPTGVLVLMGAGVAGFLYLAFTTEPFA